MTKIIFEGWEVGMRKIPFIKLLNEKAGLSLKDSKNLKDRLVDDNEIIEMEVPDENLAIEILAEAKRLKVKGRLESS
jgi:hypothetical protein